MITFALVILGSLVVLLLQLNGFIVKTADPNGYVPSTNSASFDTKAMEQIDKFRSIDDINSTQASGITNKTSPFR